MPRRVLTPEREFEGREGEDSLLDLAALAQIVAERYASSGDLIPVLQRAQRHFGYLPDEVVTEIARLTGLPASRAYGVITFYAQFSTVPSGRHKIFVCQGTACHVRGGHGVLRAVESELGIKAGTTSDDMEHTLETVACLGACSLAPVMTVDSQYFGKLTSAKAAAALEQIGDIGEIGDDGGGSDGD